MGNYMQAVDSGILGSAMANGPGHSIRNGSLGVLGAPMASGGGHAFRDGSLGSAMASGEGHAFRSGSLGGAMARGEGHAFRSGSLGAVGRASFIHVAAVLNRDGSFTKADQTYTPKIVELPTKTGREVYVVGPAPAALISQNQTVRMKFYSDARALVAAKAPLVLTGLKIVHVERGNKLWALYCLKRASALPFRAWPKELPVESSGGSPSFFLLGPSTSRYSGRWPAFSLSGALGAPLNLTTDLIIGAGIGAGVIWYVFGKKKKG